MSVRLNRAELSILLDDLMEFVDEIDIENMLPEYAFNLGVVRHSLTTISIGING